MTIASEPLDHADSWQAFRHGQLFFFRETARTKTSCDAYGKRLVTVAFFIVVIGIWVLYSGWRFYKEVDWSKSPAVNTPDVGAMKKREKELRHIGQEVLEIAHQEEVKISRALIDEFNRFYDEEIAKLPLRRTSGGQA